jgi:hypothetical protein
LMTLSLRRSKSTSQSCLGRAEVERAASELVGLLLQLEHLLAEECPCARAAACR